MRSQKHIKDSERKYVAIVNERGGFAQRIAGSGCGKYGVCDVMSVENGQTYAVEVKSTQAKVLKLTSLEVERLKELQSIARRNLPLKAKLVIHWKRRGWQEIILDQDIGDLFPLFFSN
jgi:Holliday junction resolvase